jgi:hypothetical protein
VKNLTIIMHHWCSTLEGFCLPTFCSLLQGAAAFDPLNEPFMSRMFCHRYPLFEMFTCIKRTSLFQQNKNNDCKKYFGTGSKRKTIHFEKLK